jgi:DsbC/DsbD-like thiol-disulfide interchange protein
VLKLSIHSGFHIYSHVAPGDAFLATRVAVELPAGYRAVGEMSRPPFQPYNEAGTTGLYKGEVVFTQEIAGSGPGEARVVLDYQSCDSQVCLPPTTVTYQVRLQG